MKDVSFGGNASFGEMYNKLSLKGIQVPNGFATTALIFSNFIVSNDISRGLVAPPSSPNRNDYSNLDEVRAKARSLILNANFPRISPTKPSNIIMI